MVIGGDSALRLLALARPIAMRRWGKD